MIRAAIIALDGSAASRVATPLVIDFVKQRSGQRDGATSALLTGIAVLDRPTITKPQATPVGGGGLKRERDEALLSEADERTREILSEFTSACAAAGVNHETVRAEGLPHEAIAAAGRTNDLVFIGRNTNFHFQTSDDPCETFKQLLRDNPCPVVVTPDEVPQGNGVVVAYDGSRAASRALHTFALLEPNLEGLDVHVVSVDRSQQKAENSCRVAVAFLRRHAVDAQAHPISSGGKPTQVLIETADRLGARLVVMGAYGHQGLRTVFFGSTTRQMLDQCRFPLFVY